eukprot:gene12240-15380_t
MWEGVASHPALAGGFIWDWMDQSLVKTTMTPDGREIEFCTYGGDFGDIPNDRQFGCNALIFPDLIEFYTYGGDFGDIPNDRQFSCNGLISPDRVPHPALYECKAVMSALSFPGWALKTTSCAPLGRRVKAWRTPDCSWDECPVIRLHVGPVLPWLCLEDHLMCSLGPQSQGMENA